MLNPGSLRSVAGLPPPNEDDVGIWHLCNWNFFAINAWVIFKVGWFDENFYPAYKEDQDYAYRCKLAGIERKDLPGASGTHLGSQTIASDPHYAARNHDTHFNWNQSHYIMKWGADSGSERFATPYNKSDRDYRWWPDPYDTIDVRDWDSNRRAKALR
jgi:GT2 family glycosyltransferase